MRSLSPALLLVLLASSPLDAAGLRLGGSDLAGKPVQDALTALAGREGVELITDFSGSLPARAALAERALDAALLLADPRQSAMDGAPASRLPIGEFQHVPVAWLTVYVLVAADNPVEQADFRQLVALFGSRSELRRWGELGAGGDWDSRSIAPVIWSRRLSPVSGMFTHMVLEGAAPRQGLLEVGDPKELLDTFANQPGLIALAPFAPSPGSGARALRIARTPGFPAGVPTPEAIANGDYPLRLPLELVFLTERATELAPLLRMFASPETRAALEKAMLVPQPAAPKANATAGSGQP